jgi:hypothetical protein
MNNALGKLKCGWKNVCGAPMGKGRAIQRLSGGDIPALSEWSSLPGQAMVTRIHPLRLTPYGKKGEGG